MLPCPQRGLYKNQKGWHKGKFLKIQGYLWEVLFRCGSQSLAHSGAPSERWPIVFVFCFLIGLSLCPILRRK